MRVPFQREVVGIHTHQPARIVDTRFGFGRHSLVDHQARALIRITLELLLKHLDVVLVDVRIAREDREVPGRVARQTRHQFQKHGCSCRIERQPEAYIRAANIERHGQFALVLVRQELVEQVTRR